MASQVHVLQFEECVCVFVCVPVLQCVCVQADGLCDVLQSPQVFWSQHVLLKHLNTRGSHYFLSYSLD